ncbi:MAG: hypothetical protein R3B70_17755 [Polyangiaceae bacterium]
MGGTGAAGGTAGDGGGGTAGNGGGGAGGTAGMGGGGTAGMGGMGGTGGSVGGGGSGGCALEEKLCFNICVPTDDPTVGCAGESCDPCSDNNALPGCVAGECAVIKCDANFADCDADAANGCEVDLPNDPDNCGACGNTCNTPNATPGCEANECTIDVCDAPWVDCDGLVANGCEINPQFDPNNCGGCNMPCLPGEQCEAGVCGVFCDPGKANCDGDALNGCETDLGTLADCAFCDDACDLANATPDCLAADCVILACDPGFEDCDALADNGCEANLETSAQNCGACGQACPTGPNATAVCQSGACGLVCAGGFADCDLDPITGCEQPTLTDPSNCGGCGNVCVTPNATPGCAAGSCKIATCNLGFADCDLALANGCEVALGNDTANCGACGNACPIPANATANCGAGTCGYTCNAGFADCDGDPANGCEVNLQSDPLNCGVCKSACNLPNANAACSAGICTVASCNAGFANCDGQAGNGCEINLLADPTNCGSCANACNLANAAQACVGGACKIGSCNAPFADCDGQTANGCETNLQSNLANCGSCGNACSLANSSSTCTNGACAVGTCNAGFDDCDGQASNGCETNLNASVVSCGACGNACNLANASQSCNNGSCAIGSCNAGFGNCDGQTANGCETSTATSVTNCGACGNVCNLANSNEVCTSGACAIGTCDAGFANCDNQTANGCEINLNSSVANCGACGNACNLPNAGAACTGGSCAVASCNAGFADCNAAPGDGCEINLNTNVTNCGACGNVCNLANAAEVCSNGGCAIGMCDAGFGNCDGTTANGCEINLTNNVANCGLCGNACNLANASEVCASGACAIGACDAGFANCDNQTANGCEINLTNNVSNCGACGNTCVTPNGAPACSAGACAVASCNAGFADCDGTVANGCEINTNNNVNNCGACGNVCNLANSTEVCSNGGCAIGACDAGFGNCDGNTANGCEANLNTSVSNCGLCGNVCNLPNATSTCTAGACGIASCNAGFADCDGNVANGCETNLNTSVGNCGACGNLCDLANANEACVGGSCSVATCNAGFGNCDNQPANGCEVNLNNSVGNCGSCGNLCSYSNAGASCSNGSCAMGSCTSGFANCDGNTANGCEVNTNTSTNNCGSCGNVCNLANASSACTSGACTVATCNAGFANCDGNNGNGCEINLANNVNNCGGCGNVCNLPHAVEMCTAGMCGVAACDAGWADCDGNPANGCEVNIAADNGNCGACGSVCSVANGTGTCSMGSCQIASCNAGFANCDGLAVNGCEINTNTSVGNCGGCGQICAPANSTGACSGGTCTVGSCNSGFANCNGSAVDGCEINTQADVQNCGACGNNCAVQCAGNTSLTQCTAGACGIQSCQAGYYNVDGLCSGGCECQASNVSQSCNTPASLGTINIGGSATTSANLVPLGTEAWYTVTFTGNTNPAYHPRVRFTTNPGSAFQFDIRTNCSGGTLGCGVEGGNSNGKTDWETFNGAGSAGYYNPIPPVGNNGTILIRVYRKAGQPLSCGTYTLTVSN